MDVVGGSRFADSDGWFVAQSQSRSTLGWQSRQEKEVVEGKGKG
jgi:hypothetical protein